MSDRLILLRDEHATSLQPDTQTDCQIERHGRADAGKVRAKRGGNGIAAQGQTRRPWDEESLGFGRLVSVDAAARYLGVSPWLVHQYIQAGDLPTTELPRPRTASALRSGARRPCGDTLRLVLLDRADLDAFVDERGRKERRSR